MFLVPENVPKWKNQKVPPHNNKLFNVIFARKKVTPLSEKRHVPRCKATVRKIRDTNKSN